MLKKIAKITGIILIVLIAVAFILPFAFKGKIMQIAKTEINKNVNANVDFKDIDISLFRHFPRLAVGLEALQVTGTGDFLEDTLIAAKQIDVALNLMSLFGGDQMKIYSITIDKPRIHAIVNKDGKANWNITVPDTAAAASPEAESSFNIQLKKYAIKDGYISYIDIPGDMSSEIFHLDHSGSGDFTADLFTLKTTTSAESVSFTYTKIPYLINTKTTLDADIQVDNRNDTYTFKTDDIALNDLKLSAEGYFQFVNDTTYGMDIQFNAPSTEFKTLLSLVPAIYKNDFEKIKTSGKAIFNGFVKGKYNAVKMPAYHINLNIEDGFFQYPDLPQPVKNIAIALKVDNPDGVTDNTVVDLSKGHIEFGNDPFDFKLLLKKPVTDQYIDAWIKGKLNLAQVTQFVKLSGDTKLSGLLDADATAKGNVAVITQQKPGPFSANGFITVTNLNYSSGDFPQPVRNSNIQVKFDNPDGVADHTVIHVPAAHIEIGNDPIDFNVLIKNPATALYFDGNAKGKFNLANAAQFTSFEPGTTLSGLLSANIAFKGNKTDIDKEAYDRINLSGTLNVADMQYASKDYPTGINISSAALTFNPKNITLNSLKAEYLKAHITASGAIDNAIGYALKDEPVAGALQVHADKLNLNGFMGTETAAATTGSAAGAGATSSEPFAVPGNVAFTLQAAIDELIYDKTSYYNLKGTVAIKDETVSLKNLEMNALDGKIGLNGSYSTKTDKKHPAISLAYDVKELSVEKTFYAFNTVQQLMPIGKFISGVISSQLTLNGKLGSDMSPVVSTLTGKGNLLLLEGVLKKFAPLEKVAQTLNVTELNGLTLKDIKTHFEFANGKVLVQPFHVKVKDIDMEIGGMHGLDQSINYAIGMKLPRSLIGTQGNALINNLAQQAGSKGIPVKLSDYINLNIKMGGTISNPQIKTDLKEAAGDAVADMKQQAADFAQQKIDSAKKTLQDSAKAIKNEVIKDLKEEVTKQLLGGKKDSADSGKPLENTKKNAEQAVKNTLKDLLKKKPVKDTTKKE
ncbi:AsmA-like C-terminal region-containing protein [Agriterribacter sp.]|uniref:AsmA-like C-terminal region-containing protein n=1 Tax=Agriterribacter sp. TaxID=2821509 RepID=UPI002CE1E93E|nr:AsmA-like C-terminal region-containing protein [Agriterribacter sp.]HTN08866.1 AsmA-like C-terminal region-containing protein [Agriterribacter sp.]